MSDDRQRRIQQRAHEIWQREGCPDGRAEEHWRRATAEIEEEEAAVAVTPISAPVAKPEPEAAAKSEKAAAKRAVKPRAATAKTESVKAEEPRKTVRKKK